MRFPDSRLHRKASALVITLAMMLLISILAIGMFTASRTEVGAARLSMDNVRAQTAAQTGESMAITKILAATSGTYRAWVSQPGRITASAVATGSAVFPMTTVYDLNSGTNASTATDTVVNLNSTLVESPTTALIIPTASFTTGTSTMNLQWIYVHASGSFDTTPPTSAVNTADPYTARFAYWVDDEGTKINANTAGTRAGNTNISLADPSHIELGVLPTGTDNSLIRTFMASSTGHYFNSPLEVRQAGGSVASYSQGNPNGFTHYSWSPNLNMFGSTRIMLTTQQKRAIVTNSDGSTQTNPFINILQTPNSDPGVFSNINTNSYQGMIGTIAILLDRKDWAVNPGPAYYSKFESSTSLVGNNTPDSVTNGWADQMAAEIIEYVRAKESTNSMVEPCLFLYSGITPNVYTGTKSIDFTGVAGGANTIGTTRAPMWTEMGIWVSATATGTTYSGVFTGELYMPSGTANIVGDKLIIRAYPWASVNGTSQINWYSSTTTVTPGTYTSTSSTSAAYTPTGVLASGSYNTVTAYVPNVGSSRAALAFTAILVDSATNVISYAPIFYLPHSPSGTYFSYPVDSTSITNYTAIHTMSIVDPLIGKSGADWIFTGSVAGAATNTFGLANPTSLDSARTYTGPQPDTDSGGGTVYNSAQIPWPAGSTSNTSGIVQSVAELGVIHINGAGWLGNTNLPWRTIRLQPSSNNNGIPDWAIVDLFCVPPGTNGIPNANTTPLTQPNIGYGDTNVGGVININAAIAPFATNLVTRTLPLQALFSGVATNSAGATNPALTVSNIASNITSLTLASANGNLGTNWGLTNAFYSPGEMVEIAGVADKGEASEYGLRGVLDVASTRSGVFSIYSVGQSIAQDRTTGAIHVLGEYRRQRMIELIHPNAQTSQAVSSLATNAVSFRTILTRKLNP